MERHRGTASGSRTWDRASPYVSDWCEEATRLTQLSLSTLKTRNLKFSLRVTDERFGARLRVENRRVEVSHLLLCPLINNSTPVPQLLNHSVPKLLWIDKSPEFNEVSDRIEFYCVGFASKSADFQWDRPPTCKHIEYTRGGVAVGFTNVLCSLFKLILRYASLTKCLN